jgi:hypothetical protein
MFYVRRSSRCGIIILLGLIAGVAAAAGHGGGVIVTVIPGEKPRKDQVCVAGAAKVGDTFKNASGDLLTIKALSGFSLMCRKSNLGILASVEFSESRRFKSALTIELPEGFVKRDPTEKEKFDGTRMRLVDKSASLYIRVESWERHEPFDFKAFADGRRKTLQTTGVDVAQTDIESLNVHGAPAFRWETETKPWSPFVAHITEVTTVLEGDAEIVLVKVYGPTKSVEQAREKVLAIGASVMWQGKDEIPSPAAMPQTVAPGASAASPCNPSSSRSYFHAHSKTAA